MTDAPVAAVVVNHDAGEYLIECVKSLRAAGVRELVVVDNASSDGSLERLAVADAEVRLVPTGTNRGYGAAANRGVALTSAPIVLVCNPDLVVSPDAPRLLAAQFAADEGLGACGPRLLEPSGAVYPSARRFPSYPLAAAHALCSPIWPDNPFSRRYRREDEPVEPGEVDWVSGACLALRRDAFASVGGFDEAYFMYVEDLDLCWRLGRAGWSVRYAPEAVVTHVQGASTAHRPIRMLLAHHASTWRFACKSTTGSARLLLPAVAVALVGRLAFEVVRSLADPAAGERGRE